MEYYLREPEPHTCHDGSTEAGDGFKFINKDGRDVYTFGIGGTSTSQVYQFRGIDDVGNDNLIKCYRATDSIDGTGTSVKGETWQAPITGLTQFYVKLVSINVGGTSIVKGKAEKS